MTQATINGHTYSDDGTSGRDMRNGGHRTWFLPMVGDVATVAGVVAGQAAQATIDAANAANGAAATNGTSTTSLTVSAGSKSITTQSGKQFTAGNYVTISRTSSPSTMMHGIVTSYSGTALVVEVATSAGGGTYTDWTISLSGPMGATGPTGDGSVSYFANSGAYTLTAADKAKLVDCSGTFTLSFQAAATLGATWATHIRNSGTGVITLDPNGSETIDGESTLDVYPGVTITLVCNGTALFSAGVSSIMAVGYFKAKDVKASGTHGGTSISGVNTRTLNTVVVNTIAGATLAANTITLPKGGYEFSARAPSQLGTKTIAKLSLYNDSDATFVDSGPATQDVSVVSVVSGRFSISSTKSFTLSHYIGSGISTFGLGTAASSSQEETYAEIEIWRLA